MVLVTVLALQLCLPLVAAGRRHAPRGIAVTRAAWSSFCQPAGGGHPGAGRSRRMAAHHRRFPCGPGSCGVRLLPPQGSRCRGSAPVALGSLAAFSKGSLLTVELVLGVSAVYAALMVVAEPRRAWKGWYFVAARVLTAGLALVPSYDITASATAVSVTFAVVLAAQHAVRWAMRARLAEVPFQQAAVWITLAGQAILPLVYVAGQRTAALRAPDVDGGRWVVLFELLVLLASAAVARRLFTARGALYFAVYGALFGVLALGPLIMFGGTFRFPRRDPHRDHHGTAVRSVACSCRGRSSAQAERGRRRY